MKFLTETRIVGKLVVVAAVGRNLEIGRRGDLIWRLSEDLAFFRSVTMGHYIVMGKKTYESMPKNLPGRKYVVISKYPAPTGTPQRNLQGVPLLAKGVDSRSEDGVCESVDKFLEFAKAINDVIYVVGGGSIYAQLLPYCSEMVLTHIDAECDTADVFFPKFDEKDWQVTKSVELCENGINYQRVWRVRSANISDN